MSNQAVLLGLILIFRIIRLTSQEENTPSSQNNTKTNNERILGPYGWKNDSYIIELAVVVDNSLFKAYNNSTTAVNEYVKIQTNNLNFIFQKLNVFIALVHLEIWSDGDKIDVLEDSNTTYHNFEIYAKKLLEKEHIDDVQLISKKINYEWATVGRIGTSAFGVSRNRNISSMDWSIANNMGILAKNCTYFICNTHKPLIDLTPCSCVFQRMASLIKNDTIFKYLKNKPIKLFDGPVCGNGFLEQGEDCDCGILENCGNSCCDAKSCRINPNISCLVRCSSNDFICGDGSCVNATKRCDGAFDCSDASDEYRCAHKFLAGEYRCNDGHYIPVNRKCDGIPDCRNYDDEIGCPSIPTTTRSTTTENSDYTNRYPMILVIAIVTVILLLIGAIILLAFICHAIIFKKYLCSHCQGQMEMNKNSSLRNGSTEGDIQHLTEFVSDSVNEFNELHSNHSASNIYEMPLSHSTTNSGCVKPSVANSVSQQNIENDAKITVTERCGTGCHKPSNKFTKPILQDSDSLNNQRTELDEFCSTPNTYEVPMCDETCQQTENISSDDHGYIICTSRYSTTSSGYMIPITATNSGSQRIIENDAKITVPEKWAPGYHRPFNTNKKFAPLFSSSLNTQQEAAQNRPPTPPPRPDLRATRQSFFHKLFYFKKN